MVTGVGRTEMGAIPAASNNIRRQMKIEKMKDEALKVMGYAFTNGARSYRSDCTIKFLPLAI